MKRVNTSSYVSPLALKRTRKALINASLASFSRKSREDSASDSDKSTPAINVSINYPKKSRTQTQILYKSLIFKFTIIIQSTTLKKQEHKHKHYIKIQSLFF